MRCGVTQGCLPSLLEYMSVPEVACCCMFQSAYLSSAYFSGYCGAQLHALLCAAQQTSQMLATAQRDHEERRALFSCYYWAIYSWNREEMTTGGPPPSLSTWKAALVCCPTTLLCCTPVQPYNLATKCAQDCITMHKRQDAILLCYSQPKTIICDFGVVCSGLPR